jgi:outer membrane receptor protein involved in Fe transport
LTGSSEAHTDFICGTGRLRIHLSQTGQKKVKMKTFQVIISSALIFLIIFPSETRASGSPAPEGECMVWGKVTDSRSKLALEYTSIVLYRAEDSVMAEGCITSADGSFSMKKIPYGTYYLVVQFIGYEKKVISPLILKKEQKEIDLGTLEIQEATSEIGGVEISAEKQNIQYNIDKKVLNVSKDITSTGGSASDALRNAPSVNVDAEGNVTLRGSSNYTVLIDGRPVPQDGNDVLKQTPAGVIENIEIITNPSAKYDPDGTAGIINIIMKKNRADGFNGMLNASYGTFDKYGADVQLNVKTGKFNLFGGAEYRNRRDKVFQNIEKTWYSGDTAQNTFSEVKQEYHPWNVRLQLGADYQISGADFLSLSGSWFRQDFRVSSPIAYHIFSQPLSVEEWRYYTNDLTLEHQWGEGNLFYKHNFKKAGHEISIKGAWNQWQGDKFDQQNRFMSDADWQNMTVDMGKRKRFYDNGSQRISGDIDYSLPLKKEMKLEAGYSIDLTEFQSDYSVMNYDPATEEWQEDAAQSNGFRFDYDIHALYTTLSGKLWGFGYQLGLRGEYFTRSLITEIPDSNYAMEIWSVFPTLHLSKEFGKGHAVMLSYSKRVNRPSVMALNPLPYFSDEYLIHSGNPALRPEYAHSIELGWQKYFKESMISAEIYYRTTTDKFTEIIQIREGQTVLTNLNMANDQATGIELMGNFTISKIFRINAGIDAFYYHLQGDDAGLVSSRHAYTASVSFNPSLIFKSGTSLQLQSFYNAPGIDAVGEMEGFFMLNLAVRQEFLKKKLSLSLSASNLFGLTGYHYKDRSSQYLHRFDYVPEGNTFTLGISYKINNYIRRNHQQGNGTMDVGF